MHELTIYPPSAPGRPKRLCVSNCDKEGSIVSARIASAIGAVSSTRPIAISTDRYTDETYFRDIAGSLAEHYRLVTDSSLLDRQTVVLSSVHRAALYVAESLHAILLPLQVLSFARNYEEAVKTPLLSIVGCDYGVDSLWQWNKVSDVSHFPDAYIDILKRANSVVVLRSTDTGDDCPVLGRIGRVFVNSTLPRLNPTLWSSLEKRLVDRECSFTHLRQWEWGLPDATVDAARALWHHLGKQADQFHVIELGTVELYRRIPVLWEEYLKTNSVRIRGVTLNAYWTAHPYYERYAGLIPIHFYRFSMLRDVAARFLEAYGTTDNEEGRMCAFLNNVGSGQDCNEAQKLISDKGLQDAFWFSTGFDCPDAECKDIYGKLIPKPFEKVAEWMPSAPYRSRKWHPMDIQSVLRIMNKQDTQPAGAGDA